MKWDKSDVSLNDSVVRKRMNFISCDVFSAANSFLVQIQEKEIWLSMIMTFHHGFLTVIAIQTRNGYRRQLE